MMDSAKFFMHIGLGMLSGLGGLFHIVYCCLFFTSGVGLWNAAILISISLYGLFLWRPGPKFLVYSHLLLLFSGSTVLILTAIGIHCSRRRCSIEAWSRPMQEQCLLKFQENPALLQGMSRIHTAIHSLLVLEAVLQIILSLSVMVKYFFAFIDAIKDHFNAYYLQGTFGLIAFVFGCLQTMFCSHFYFLGVGVWASAGIFCSALCYNCHLPPKKRKATVTSRTLSRSSSSKTIKLEQIDEDDFSKTNFHRIVVYALIGFSAVLVLYGTLGTYCWEPVSIKELYEIEANFMLDPNATVTEPKCDNLLPKSIYHSCYNGLEAIGFWHRDHDPELKGLGKFQQAMTAMLLICGGSTLLVNAIIWYRKRRRMIKNTPPPVVV